MSIETVPIRLILVGSEGRMGIEMTNVCAVDPGATITGRVDRTRTDLPDDAEDTVVVDFSSEAGTQRAIIIAQELETPILVGTTALGEGTMNALQELSTSVPVAHVSNTSIGIALLHHLLRVAGQALRDEPRLDVSVRETHHTGKLDAPSGTALSLVNSLSNLGLNVDEGCVESIRHGQVPGEHEVGFTLGRERLTLKHEALDRSLFAEGALHLARTLLQQEPGLYDVPDLLDLRIPTRIKP